MIVVDLTPLAFTDSSGVALMIRLNDRPDDRLRVINGSPAVERVFRPRRGTSASPLIAKDDDPLIPLKERRQHH